MRIHKALGTIRHQSAGKHCCSRSRRIADGNTARGNAQGGFALVLSLILVIVVSGLCIGFVRLAAATSRAQTGSVDQMRAFYLAEAGLAEAFHAVRMGRSGRIASPQDGAAYGDGLLWVESAQTPDRKVWLRATAVVGGGRAMLGLVVDPAEQSLGFFAEENLVIESGVLVDGFDSTERLYEEEIAIIQGLLVEEAARFSQPFIEDDSVHRQAQESANHFASLMPVNDLLSVLRNQVYSDSAGNGLGNEKSFALFLENGPINVSVVLEPTEYSRFLGDLAAMKAADEAGALQPSQLLMEQPIIELDSVAVDRMALLESGSSKAESPEVSTAMAEGSDFGLAPADEEWSIPGEVSPEQLILDESSSHTMSGGRLGSNGDVTFLASEPGEASIFGSVTPGVNGSVIGGAVAEVTGATEQRALTVELSPVVIPDLGEAVDVVHSGLIARVLQPGDQSIGTLHVDADSEVIVRGPARLVVHDLVLVGGASLTLDTRDGDVELFVTGGVDMDPASFVETTGATAKEVSIQAGPASPGEEAPDLALDAQSRFRGTIYAPESTVHIGGNFEIFGSATARRLEIGAGARLHFDDESYNGVVAIPRQDAWEILDLPPSTERPSRLTVDLAASPGGDPRADHASLAEAHRLSDVAISIRYIDQSGVEQRYAGTEKEFDWSQVASIEAQERLAVRIEIVETGGKTGLADPSSGEDEWSWDDNFEDQVQDMTDWFASQGGAGSATLSPLEAAKAESKALKAEARQAERALTKALTKSEVAEEASLEAKLKAAEAAGKALLAAEGSDKEAAAAEAAAAKEAASAAEKAAKAAEAEADVALKESVAAAAAADAAEAKAVVAAERAAARVAARAAAAAAEAAAAADDESDNNDIDNDG